MTGQHPGNIRLWLLTGSLKVGSHENHLLLFLHPYHGNSGRGCRLGGDGPVPPIFYSTFLSQDWRKWGIHLISSSRLHSPIYLLPERDTLERRIWVLSMLITKWSFIFYLSLSPWWVPLRRWMECRRGFEHSWTTGYDTILWWWFSH